MAVAWGRGLCVVGYKWWDVANDLSFHNDCKSVEFE